MKKNILVIDDEEPIRRLFSRILTGAGYDVMSASNGIEALEKLKSAPIDLIMLDMNMPEMDGLSFLRRVKDDNLTHVPVLMVSGESNSENIIESYKLGVYDFIRKPEQTEVMLKRVENGLKIGEMINFNEFIRVELMMAKKLQKYLYPEPLLITDRVKINTWSKPLSDIGGDLYDYVLFRDDRMIFFVADVSGHSISASLYTAIVKMVFRNALQKTDVPGELLTLMNQELSGNIPIELFVTAFCGLYDPAARVLRYSNAGHPKPYHMCGNKSVQLEGNDSFLGPIANAVYKTYSVNLKEDSCIMAYTDGVLDVIGENSTLIGDSMLRSFLNAANKTPMEKFTMIQEYIMGPEAIITDDCTIMLVDLI